MQLLSAFSIWLLVWFLYIGASSPTVDSLRVVKNISARQKSTEQRFDPNKSVTNTVYSNVRGILGCALLKVLKPNLTHLQNTTSFARLNSRYYSQTAKTKPICIFTPESADDMSFVMSTIYLSSVPYNVLSMGQNAIRGLAGVDDGILISTSRMNKIELMDNGIVRIGAGANWGAVMNYLEERGLTTLGARAGSVGVGGFLLGGGISFQTNQYGFACDYVENYEIILINGTKIEVNKTNEHRELFSGLKGAGSNFGVVTRFDMRTMSSLPVFGGVRRTFTRPRGEHLNAVLELFQKSPEYTRSQVVFSYTRNFPLKREYVDMVIFSNNFTGLDSEPPRELRKLMELKADTSTVRVRNISSLVMESSEPSPANPGNNRRELRGFSVKLNPDLLRDIITIFENEIVATNENAWIPTIGFQYIPDTSAYMSKRRGGNMLGVNGGFVLVNLAAYWLDPVLDKRITRAMDAVTEKSIALSISRKLDEQFVYYNYAPPMLNPIKNYGDASIKKLQMLKKRYDPYGELDRLLYGAFRIPKSN